MKLLGDGTFGRVVHAHDTREGREIAIKIIRDVKRYMENAQIEADILKDIRKADPSGESGCAIMYDTFVHESKFFCLVFEPLGMSLYDFMKDNDYRGYWLQDIQSYGRQCMRALAFLHDTLRMTHTDLKPENVLLYSQQPAQPSTFPREVEWMRHNGHPPDYNKKQYLRPVNSDIKIIDFGNATYENEQHSSIINTRQYRGPEVLLSCGWNELSDQWSIGCILMELYSGNQLFETHEEMEHLALMERIIGTLPSSMIDSASKSAKDKWFMQREGRHRLCWPERSSSSTSERHVFSQRSLSKQVPSAHSGLAEFCAELLELEPRNRKSANAMLRHPFLTKMTYQD
jgi:serine/threonine protein kinase